jgi:hypothetical protein
MRGPVVCDHDLCRLHGVNCHYGTIVKPKSPVRTICADCRWHKLLQHPARYRQDEQAHFCTASNARDLITGEPTSCSRNDGRCPDYEAKP